MSDQKPPLTYASAGVDIDAGNALVDRIKPAVARTQRPGVASGLGGFGGLFDLKAAGFNDPILVAATDGVGTKLRIAIDTNNLETIGIDLVAMCVNDLICQGAEPLFFLDYFATGKLDLDKAETIISGIAKGCEASGCALIGGETAEMPGMYAASDFDLAGFAIGAMERGSSLPRDVMAGDVLIGIASDGAHSNGYSLIRKIVEQEELSWADPAPFANDTLGAALLTPTRLYVKPALSLLKGDGLKALAHITGGGITENLPRVLAEGLGASVDLNAWTVHPALAWLIDRAKLDQSEALKTFNCGIGMIAVVSKSHAEGTLDTLVAAGETATIIGSVTESNDVTFKGSLL